jgi:hypothetical protein
MIMSVIASIHIDLFYLFRYHRLGPRVFIQSLLFSSLIFALDGITSCYRLTPTLLTEYINILYRTSTMTIYNLHHHTALRNHIDLVNVQYILDRLFPTLFTVLMQLLMLCNRALIHIKLKNGFFLQDVFNPSLT